MAREVTSPHKTFLIDWTYAGSQCDGDRFFRIVTADYSRDAQCHPKIYDFAASAWVNSGDGWCNANDHSQYNCVAEGYGSNGWPSGAKGLRWHYATRNDPNGGANGGSCQGYWWTGWTSRHGSSSDVVENFNSWSGQNANVELFYKSSSDWQLAIVAVAGSTFHYLSLIHI